LNFNAAIGKTMNVEPYKLSDLLQFTSILDGFRPSVNTFAHTHADGISSVRDKAVRLYYAVRDGIRYDPYTVDLTTKGMRASRTLATGRAWCVPKAILLATCCRIMGIPAGLGFADVRNHLTTTRLKKVMNTDVFFWHGYTTILIDGQWVKATPAFNIELCERFKLKALEFDGISDSLFQPFDLMGNAHMEYIHYRGEFSDAPIDRIKATFERHYMPMNDLASSDFDQDAKAENPQSFPL
jgi:transglutaminase-like putative cysteine protease